MKSQSVRTKCSVSESKQKEKRKIKRVRENIQKESSKRKEKESFFTQVVSLSVVISILYSEIIRSLSRGFSLQGERVST